MEPAISAIFERLIHNAPQMKNPKSGTSRLESEAGGPPGSPLNNQTTSTWVPHPAFVWRGGAFDFLLTTSLVTFVTSTLLVIIDFPYLSHPLLKLENCLQSAPYRSGHYRLAKRISMESKCATCNHLYDEGGKCKSAAVTDQKYCTYHLRYRARQLRMAQFRARNQRFDLKLRGARRRHDRPQTRATTPVSVAPRLPQFAPLRQVATKCLPHRSRRPRPVR